jgi:SAM-dependent methyltransferase
MSVTRGNGILEEYLAKQRASLADSIILESARIGRILDLGCGTTPYFLISTRFHEKHGLDKVLNAEIIRLRGKNICVNNFDIEKQDRLPYANEHFDVVTMLAVIEHIEPMRLVGIMKEVLRVLKPGGQYILTTPAAWTDSLLRLLARINLMSREEIDEHKDAYSHGKIIRLLKEAGFGESKIQRGYFESYMNIWVSAIKHPSAVRAA